MKNKKQLNLTMILSAIYFCILIWIILFKMNLSFSEIDNNRSINIIPFSGSVIVNGKIYISEIINNILVFVPVGIYTCMLKQDWSFTKKTSVAFLISLSVEVLQFIFAIGATDITDLIGNTLGGVIGIGIYSISSKVFKSKTVSIFNTLAFIATVGLVCLLYILLLLN
ncbi:MULTISPECIES: VanZ family protein [unclassified Romboutsia]|uniref:VanZ family protein n=1 Tax=unclassified Romboutsia TaxID=2626894 RepID=UPI000F0514A0|nr:MULTISPECIES: VanZ family protein [unclassified Romboutsia]